MADVVHSLAVENVWTEVQASLSDYEYDHYRRYPATSTDGWEALLLGRIRVFSQDNETTLIHSRTGGGVALVALHAKQWDHDHFGFPTASIEVLIADPAITAFCDCLKFALSLCREKRIKFVSARVNGDQLGALHAFENSGFRYYENIIWPIVSLKHNDDSWSAQGVRPMNSEEVEKVAEIASTNQYQRGHFHCDPMFSKRAVDELYGKWVRTAFQSKKPVIIIENDGKAAGYFVLELVTSVSNALGVRYGGMRSLGLDASARGKGLGRRLFCGALAWLRDQGCEYVDSGYATKNHVSAKLHTKAGFASVYEEATLHLWLS